MDFSAIKQFAIGSTSWAAHTVNFYVDLGENRKLLFRLNETGINYYYADSDRVHIL